jgi:acetoin utilization protein AcuC
VRPVRKISSPEYIQFSFIREIEYYRKSRIRKTIGIQETQINLSRPTIRPEAVNSPLSATHRAAFICSDVYRRQAFGQNHPLSIIRVAGVMDVCRMLGWLDETCYLESPRADSRVLLRFHQPDYLEALRRADSRGAVDRDDRLKYRIGTMENPLFPGLFERASTAVGGSILAAEQALLGKTTFHPSGGTHHGRPDRASGFCYFNDPVFAVLTLLDGGLDRILYVDLDAHHGDGVQDAFADEERVFTISVHEEKRWPHSGLLNDRAVRAARNLPVPRGFNDTELGYLMDHAILPLAHGFAPQAVVITCGTDALDGDPLSRLKLSNLALWDAVERLVELTQCNVVLGGGGYNPWTLIRCWTGLWARLSGRVIPDGLPLDAQSYLQALECDLIDEEDVHAEWISTLADRPNHGPVRDEIKRCAEAVTAG